MAQVVVAAASPDYNGTVVGTVFQADGDSWVAPDETRVYVGETFVNMIYADSPATHMSWATNELGSLPARLFPADGAAAGWVDLEWGPTTNSQLFALSPADVTNAAEYVAGQTNAAHVAAADPHGDRAYADALVAAAPEWMGITNLAASVTLTNDAERPVYLYSTGTVSLAFSGLRAPMPLYLIVRGPDSLTVPGAYYVGGGSFQTNMANHYIVWQWGTNLLVNPVTATED
jgi:hypothetical protein